MPEKTAALPLIFRFGLRTVFAGAICLVLAPRIGCGLQSKESPDPYFQPEKAKSSELTPKTPPSTGTPGGYGALTPSQNRDARQRQDPTAQDGTAIPTATGEGTANAIQQAGFRDSDGLPTGTADPDGSMKSDNPDSALRGAVFQPGQVLARVGGHPVFVADLLVEANQLLDKFLPGAPQTVRQQELNKLIPQLLPKYIQGKLLFVDAVESLPEGANFEDAMESAREQFDELVLPELMDRIGVNSPALLDAHYRAMGSSLRRTRDNWAETELVKYLAREKMNMNPEVTHREIHDTWLAERDDKWSVPEKVKWERLSVHLDKYSGPDSKRQAWNALRDMGNEVVYGAPLEAVSKRSSHDPLASSGGMQGWISRGSLVDSELEELLFTMEVGELSQIRETRRGFEIVRVLERTSAHFVPFEEAQVDIRKRLLEQKQEAEYKRYTDEISKRIPVEVFTKEAP